MNNVSGTICALLMLAAISADRTANAAETYPTRPIKLIIPFSAGGIGDVIGRLVRACRHLSQERAQTR